ncbi:hypothetical protein ABZS59_07215 [Streptomyces flaveolus]|uniref:hypothetical protein n=1 Tax=Streptomyces flaveolus TaxID=67297 RepID=UPI0033AD1575
MRCRRSRLWRSSRHDDGHPCGVSPACVLLTPDVAAFTDAIGTTNTDFARR